MNKQKRKFLGIDPGTRLTGYGIIEEAGTRFQALDYGCIRPTASLPLYDRYLIIFDSVSELIARWSPDTLVIEGQFVRHNPRIALKLGMACCAAVLAARKLGLEVVEYSPRSAKQAITGRGNASKQQMQWMVQKLLNLAKIPEPEDAADALGLALCHGQRLTK